MNVEDFNSLNAPKPVGAYPHAKKIGNFLFLSGIGPRETETDAIPGVKSDKNGIVISYNIEKQCHSVFKNVNKILLDSGSSWDNLIDITVFLTDMKNDFAIFNKIYKDYFINNLPCRTTVGVNSLPTPIAIELKCIAFIK